MADGTHSPRHALLEVCVDTAAGVRAAATNGADRIELCQALAVGGLTPSPGLMRMASACGLPVRAMIRPREGDFCYTADEIGIMEFDIDQAAAHGLDGVVVCANHADGRLHHDVLRRLCGRAKAQRLSVALHRGFDLAPDPSEALEMAIALDVATVLTSGGAKTAREGMAGLAMLMQAAQGRIEILAGSGVTGQDVAELHARAGATAFHASCSRPLPPGNERAAALGYVTSAQRDTDPARVAKLRHILNSLTIGSAHVFR